VGAVIVLPLFDSVVKVHSKGRHAMTAPSSTTATRSPIYRHTTLADSTADRLFHAGPQVRLSSMGTAVQSQHAGECNRG
jgi:hypothetical protein